MSAIKLHTKYVEKPWGRTDLPAAFPDGAGRQIGEVWFDGPDGRHPPLLVKYIFTSERLSIQVHPNDEQGRARGLPGGKSECWLITAAEPDARLGVGTIETLVKPIASKRPRSQAKSNATDRLEASQGRRFFLYSRRHRSCHRRRRHPRRSAAECRRDLSSL